MPHQHRGGFTLIEMMIVVVIMGILAAVVLPNVIPQAEGARIKGASAQVMTLETALNSFYLDCSRYPTTSEGLQALVQDPGLDAWHGPYLTRKELNEDPWGNEYCYSEEPDRGVDFDVFSKGPDGQENTDDDIGNWKMKKEKDRE